MDELVFRSENVVRAPLFIFGGAPIFVSFIRNTSHAEKETIFRSSSTYVPTRP